MKSAYELAMERYGSEPITELSHDQRIRIAEIDSFYRSKIAEAEVMTQQRIMNAAGDPVKLDSARCGLADEIASFQAKAERKKEEIRQENS